MPLPAAGAMTGQTPAAVQQPGQPVGAQVDDQVIAGTPQIPDQGETALPALLLVAMDHAVPIGAVREQFAGTGIGDDVHEGLRVFAMQRLHDRCGHDGIADVAERHQQDMANRVRVIGHRVA